MYISFKRKEEIRCLADELLLASIGPVVRDKFPLDLGACAKGAGLTVKLGEFENIFAAYCRNDKLIFVQGNTIQAVYRYKAFAAAHFLGHFLMHKEKFSEIFRFEEFISKPNGGMLLAKPKQIDRKEKEMEREADYFAAHLVIPEGILRQARRRTEWSLFDLSVIFGAPYEATGFRFKEKI